uniref:Nicotianamine synthase n=1 Tax=Oryza meridionalis TaxID=40149 RepID=A0A0E0C6L5_9ORYZ
MATGVALVMWSSDDAHGFLYPTVDPKEIRCGGFGVIAVHYSKGEVINSVIIARKPLVAVDRRGPLSPPSAGCLEVHMAHGLAVGAATKRGERKGRGRERGELAADMWDPHGSCTSLAQLTGVKVSRRTNREPYFLGTKVDMILRVREWAIPGIVVR